MPGAETAFTLSPLFLSVESSIRNASIKGANRTFNSLLLSTNLLLTGLSAWSSVADQGYIITLIRAVVPPLLIKVISSP